MKKKLLSLLILVFISLQSFSLKDSSLVFTIGIGLNYNNSLRTNSYDRTQESEYISTRSWLSYKDTSGFSPIIKVGMKRMYAKRAGLNISASYTFNKFEYTTYARDDYYRHLNLDTSTNTWGYTSDYHSTETNYKGHQHNLVSSIGFPIYIKQFYICPKVDLVFSFIDANVNELKLNHSYTGPPLVDFFWFDSTTYAYTKQTYEFTCGSGLAIGYDFKIGGKVLFIELQADYFLKPRESYMIANRLNGSFTIGIGL